MGAAYCRIAPGHPVHAPHHDLEYGFPVRDAAALFERLMLEINQAGLSGLTILNKRAAFRAAFVGFEVDRVASFGAGRRRVRASQSSRNAHLTRAALCWYRGG